MSKTIIKVDRYIHIRPDGNKVIYSKGQEVYPEDVKSIAPRFLKDENGNTTPMDVWATDLTDSLPEIIENPDKTTPVIVKAK